MKRSRNKTVICLIAFFALVMLTFKASMHIFAYYNVNGNFEEDNRAEAAEKKSRIPQDVVPMLILDSVSENSANPAATGTAVTPQVTTGTSVTPTETVEGQVRVTLDYINEVLTVNSGPKGSTKFYFSLDKKKTWQMVDDPSGRMDLGIFMKTSASTVYFKGDKDIFPAEVIIPKEENSMKISYYVENEVGKLKIDNVNQGESIEYRKGTSGQWKVYFPGLDLSDYEITGFTLQFRKVATASARAGKIVNVKIPKRQNLPSIKVDYSKYLISGIKAGQTQYRIAGNSSWITFQGENKVKTLSLYDLLLPKDTPKTVPIPAAAFEFRCLGTDKKAPSGILFVETLAQPVAPTQEELSIQDTMISFPKATKEKPYEYTVLHKTDKLEESKVKWTKVTSLKAITIKKVGSSTPLPGDIIYFRTACVTDRKTKETIPASVYSIKEITSVPTTNPK